MDLFVDMLNFSQDMHGQLDNLSTGIDGSEVFPENYDCFWFAIYKEGGIWKKQALNEDPSMFHLDLFSCAHLLKNGEFILELMMKEKSTGRTWSAQKPCGLAVLFIDGVFDNYMSYPGSLSAEQYRMNCDIASWAGPKFPGMHFLANKPGDFNGDGAVNVSDLLVFSGYYGK